MGVFAGQPGQTGAPGAAPFSAQAGKAPSASGGSGYGPIGSSAGSTAGVYSAAPGGAVSTNQQSKQMKIIGFSIKKKVFPLYNAKWPNNL